MLLLTDFSVQRPQFRIEQREALKWLAAIHTATETTLESQKASKRDGFAERIEKLIQRCACGPHQIGARGHVTADLGSLDFEQSRLFDVTRHPRGLGTEARSHVFAEIVNAYFEREFAEGSEPPSDLVHVTCTGYVSPSGAQRLVASRGWGARTQVTHAYHMGCYAAFPAIRTAAGLLALPASLRPKHTERRADIAHTELCTLHLDPSQHSPEQLVVQSLFGDGFVRYSVREGAAGPGLEVLALSEQVLPDSAPSMTWACGDFGMQMTLARDVPERIAAGLRGFVLELVEKAGLGVADLRNAVAAVHPGGPKIIDRVREVLELEEAQVAASRGVLFDYGNMSSATLPHVWARVLSDDSVPSGTAILSLAFGPGLTVCGGVFRKC